MNPLTRIRRSALCRIPVSLLAALLLILPPGLMPAQSPAWWDARGVTNGSPADDYAAINQGQLKNLARAAVDEFDEMLDGGAGSTLRSLVDSWAIPSPTTDDYAAVNVGQLKALAKPFYDRLKTAGLVSVYPWEGGGRTPDDYATANIGEAKNLFAFKMIDANENGLPDWWEAQWGLGEISAEDMAPGGLTYLQKYQLRLNPTVADTDGDGYDDGHEVAAGTDANNSESRPEPLDLQIAMKWASVAGTKTGFAEFVNPSDPPKFYLKKTASVTAREATAGQWDESAKISYTEEIVPASKSQTFGGTSSFEASSYAADDGRLTGRLLESTQYAASTLDWSKSNLTDSHSLFYDLQGSNGGEDGRDDQGSPIWKTTTYDEHGDYSLFREVQGGVWNGIGFNDGTITWDGSSHHAENALYPGGGTYKRRVASTTDATGSWFGTDIIDDGEPSEINDPAWRNPWYYRGNFGGTPSDTKTKRTWDVHLANGDYTYDSTGSEELDLTSEYRKEDFISNTLADMPDFPSEWDLTIPFTSAFGGSNYLFTDETVFIKSKVKYKLKANASAAQVIIWCEYFHPYDDPDTAEDESLNVTIHGQPRSWSKTATTACESPEYEVIPTAEEKNGYYTVDLLPVEMKIWNGQDATDPVPDDKKYSVGAFTVANLNDSHGYGDGVKDRDRNNVPGEKDLMKLYVGGYKGLTGKVKLTVKSGNVGFWETKEKGTPIPLDANKAVFFDIPAGGMDKTLWVEARDASGAIRDIEIWEGYQAPDGTLTDGTDKVRATAVWATSTQYANQHGQQLWADCAYQAITYFSGVMGNFGLLDPSPQQGVQMGIGFQFTVQPSGIGTEPNVKFDVTRQRNTKSWGILNGQLFPNFDPQDQPFPARDLANDDPDDIDESTGLTSPTGQPTDHLYSIDAPGLTDRKGGAYTQIVLRKKFREYVRVSFNGTRPTGSTETGSRCSYKTTWHMFMWLQINNFEFGGPYYHPMPGKENSVDVDFPDPNVPPIDPPPVP